MLKTITFSFPKDAGASNFFKELGDLLSELPNASFNQKGVRIEASHPAQALPSTIFEQRDVSFPQIHLDIDGLQLDLGSLTVNPDQDVHIGQATRFVRTTKHDMHGEYIAIEIGSQTIFRLSIAELYDRLRGHVARIDHTGINLPSTLLTKEDWKHFISKLANNCNLYQYPTGEDWPFILPATEAEYANDIKEFPAGREPKFELVYDTFSPVPTIQIDIETDLLRAEIERLFPKPYGISFPDLADYFRTVYIDHDWPRLAIRFDLRFKNDDPSGDWETGKWLVNDGGRIK